jgi:hypothetical protein
VAATLIYVIGCSFWELGEPDSNHAKPFVVIVKVGRLRAAAALLEPVAPSMLALPAGAWLLACTDAPALRVQCVDTSPAQATARIAHGHNTTADGVSKSCRARLEYENARAERSAAARQRADPNRRRTTTWLAHRMPEWTQRQHGAGTMKAAGPRRSLTLPR